MSGDIVMGYRYFLCVVVQRYYLLTEKYCAMRETQRTDNRSYSIAMAKYVSLTNVSVTDILSF